MAYGRGLALFCLFLSLVRFNSIETLYFDERIELPTMCTAYLFVHAAEGGVKIFLVFFSFFGGKF